MTYKGQRLKLSPVTEEIQKCFGTIYHTILPFHSSDANKRREWQLVETTTAEHDGDSLYQSWISIIPSYRQMSVFFLPRP